MRETEEPAIEYSKKYPAAKNNLPIHYFIMKLGLSAVVIGFAFVPAFSPSIFLILVGIFAFIGEFRYISDHAPVTKDKPKVTSVYHRYVDSGKRVVDLRGRDVADLFGLGDCPAQIRSTRLRDMTGRDLGWLFGVRVSAVGYSKRLSEMTVADLSYAYPICLRSYESSMCFMDLTAYDLGKLFGIKLCYAGSKKVRDITVLDLGYLIK